MKTTLKVPITVLGARMLAMFTRENLRNFARELDVKRGKDTIDVVSNLIDSRVLVMLTIEVTPVERKADGRKR